MHPDALQTIQNLDLLPHPEGGYFRELFRSPHNVTSADGRVRPALTVIYFLLPDDERSRWHRLASDETWHFAQGSAVAIDTLAEDGRLATLRLGRDGPWQATIPAGTAFAARVAEAGYALVTCCVAPGFAFEDFALLDSTDLAARYPQHARRIGSYPNVKD